MKRVPWILLLILLSCDKDDDPEKFSSINGQWIVRTPDQSTDVAFQIGQDADNEFIIKSVYVTHNGTAYNSKPIDAAIRTISETEIESITFVNNSTEVPFFVIRFQQISVNADFTEMLINISSFNVDGVFSEYAMITATRD